jgi:hypothetical protein
MDICYAFHMGTKYTNIFHYMALQNVPKLGILAWKNTPLHSSKEYSVYPQGWTKGLTFTPRGQSSSPGARFARKVQSLPPGGELMLKKLRAILNFTPGPQGWTLPLGVNLAPRGEIWPLRGMFTPSFTPGVTNLYCLEEWRGKQRISPPADNPRG